MGMKGMKQMAKSMKNVDMKETRDIMVSIHEHLELLAVSNIQILQHLEHLSKEKTKKVNLKDYHK